MRAKARRSQVAFPAKLPAAVLVKMKALLLAYRRHRRGLSTKLSVLAIRTI